MCFQAGTRTSVSGENIVNSTSHLYCSDSVIASWIINVSASSWLFDSDWTPLLLDVRPDADTTNTTTLVKVVHQSLICKVHVVRKISLGLLVRQKSAYRDVFNTCITCHLILDRCLSMTSLGPGCALDGIFFVYVEDQNYVDEASGQAQQHPVIKAFT